MNDLLYKSIKLSYENDSDSTIDELCYQYNINKYNLIGYAKAQGEDVSNWSKPSHETSEALPNIVSGEVLPAEDTDEAYDTEVADLTRKNLDDVYTTILAEAKSLLDTSVDLSAKDLKDIVTTVKVIEDIKYPRSSTQALEVDLRQGIVRFLATNSVDDL